MSITIELLKGIYQELQRKKHLSSFDLSTDVTKYLYARYGTLHKMNRKQEKETVISFKEDHDIEDVKIMQRRLAGEVDLLKEKKSYLTQPITILLSFATMIITFLISMFTVMVSIQLTVVGKYLDQKVEEIKKEEYEDESLRIEDMFKNQLEDMMELSPIFSEVAATIILTIVALLSIWFVSYKYYKQKFIKNQRALVLIEESISE